MKPIDLSKRLQPIFDRFQRTLTEAVTTRVDAAISDVESAFGAAIATIGTAAPTPVEPALTVRERARTKKPRRAARRDVKPAKPTAQPKSTTSPANSRTCGCGPRGRHRRDCRARNAKPGAAEQSDDSEEDGARVALAQFTRRPSRAVEPAEDLPVIPMPRLVARLAADRAHNAVGDAGGFVARADRPSSLVGHTEEKREFCRVHGWVGRVAFERDQHDLCVAREDERPCRLCEGRKMTTTGERLCRRCNGSGVEPEQIEAPQIVDGESPPTATAEPRVEYCDNGGGRRRRRRIAPRSKTIQVKRITRAALARAEVELEHLGPAVDENRPRTRGECRDAPRPCPWVGCKYHLFLDINPETGSIKLNFPDVEPWELAESCSLDLAERGGLVLEDVGNLMNLTRERVRQVEVRGLIKLKTGAAADLDSDKPIVKPKSEDDAA